LGISKRKFLQISRACGVLPSLFGPQRRIKEGVMPPPTAASKRRLPVEIFQVTASSKLK
jgi:hypothetical protein